MNIEEVQSLCKQLPGVTEDIKWGSDLCFSVGGKMFLVTALEQSPITASFKVTDEQFEELSVKPGFKPEDLEDWKAGIRLYSHSSIWF
jgi:predicted DNA-binding protein (MmcQ/YjbR family)